MGRSITIAPNRKRHLRKTVLAYLVLAGGLSNAQVGHGTVVILDFFKDKLAIAAESRTTYEDRPPQDTSCKIRQYQHRIVFVEIGAVGFRPAPRDPFRGWDNVELALRSVHAEASPQKDPDAELKDIAGIWARTLASYWNTAYRYHPDSVARAAFWGAGQISSGFFAEIRNGTIHTLHVGVELDKDKNPPVVAFTFKMGDCWPCGEGERVCAMARPMIPKEFCEETSRRAKDEAAHWRPSPELMGEISRETLHAVRLVDDTIAFDPMIGLGGKVDALELHNDGTINWIFRKPSCPENED
jgi:hypothetical protein